MKTEEEYMSLLNKANSVLELNSILDAATNDYSLFVDILGRIIDCKLYMELELFYNSKS
jgi:hypothetical protein